MTYLIIFLCLMPYLLWCDFLAVMALKAAKGKMKDRRNIFAYSLGLTILAKGYLLDFVCNVIHGTVFFFPDLPRELTVSARVKRLCNAPPGGWVVESKRARAEWFRDTLLKDFDQTGGHD